MQNRIQQYNIFIYMQNIIILLLILNYYQFTYKHICILPYKIFYANN